jgi:hypothetical protein
MQRPQVQPALGPAQNRTESRIPGPGGVDRDSGGINTEQRRNGDELRYVVASAADLARPLTRLLWKI